jgi:hypothetical protein
VYNADELIVSAVYSIEIFIDNQRLVIKNAQVNDAIKNEKIITCSSSVDFADVSVNSREREREREKEMMVLVVW